MKKIRSLKEKLCIFFKLKLLETIGNQCEQRDETQKGPQAKDAALKQFQRVQLAHQ